MRKDKVIEQNRSYQLIRRPAHRAFVRDDEFQRRVMALRDTVGTRSRIHFSRYYLKPLLEKGLVAWTDPGNPTSPKHEYMQTLLDPQGRGHAFQVAEESVRTTNLRLSRMKSGE